jgi:hypothetical protein
MSSFLTNLVRRALGDAPTVRPLVRSLFEPEAIHTPHSAGPLLPVEDENSFDAAEVAPARPRPVGSADVPARTAVGTRDRLAESDAAPPARRELPPEDVRNVVTAGGEHLERPFPAAPAVPRGRPVMSEWATPIASSAGTAVVPTNADDSARPQLGPVSGADEGSPPPVRPGPARRQGDEPTPADVTRTDEPAHLSPPPARSSRAADPAPEGVLLPAARPTVPGVPADKPREGAATVVRVEIGRIEVRAPATPPAPTAPRARPRVMTLDEYSEARKGST